MIEYLKSWYQRNFSNPQAVILVLMIVLGTIIVLYWGDILAPVLASLVIAYALEGIVRRITNLGIPRIISVIITVFVFVTTLLIVLLGLVPLVTRQLTSFVRDFPYILEKLQSKIMALPVRAASLRTRSPAANRSSCPSSLSATLCPAR